MLGPDGRPFGATPLIGAPKSLADLVPLSDADLALFCDGIEGALAQGTPIQIPIGIALVQLGQMCRALRDRAARIAELEATLAALSPATVPVTPDLNLSLSPGGRLDLSRLGNL